MLANRLSAQLPGLPVVFISGYAEDVAEGDALDPDATLVQKPFKSGELLARVRERLEASSADRRR